MTTQQIKKEIADYINGDNHNRNDIEMWVADWKNCITKNVFVDWDGSVMIYNKWLDDSDYQSLSEFLDLQSI